MNPLEDPGDRPAPQTGRAADGTEPVEEERRAMTLGAVVLALLVALAIMLVIAMVII